VQGASRICPSSLSTVEKRRVADSASCGSLATLAGLAERNWRRNQQDNALQNTRKAHYDLRISRSLNLRIVSSIKFRLTNCPIGTVESVKPRKVARILEFVKQHMIHLCDVRINSQKSGPF